MKRRFLFLAALMLLPTLALAQTPDPTPAQLQQIETDFTSLVVATSNDLAAQALIVSDSAAAVSLLASDSAAVTAAQNTLATDTTATAQQIAADQAAQAGTAGAVLAAEQQLETDVNALTPAQARTALLKAAKATAKKLAAPRPGPHPGPGPRPWPYPPYPQPYPTPSGPGQWEIINGQPVWVPMMGAAPCGCKGATAAVSQDDVDYATAIIQGLGNRVAIGPYRWLTLAVRQYQADMAAGRSDAKDRLRSAIATARPSPNPARKCNLATLAVAITPVMIEMMDPSMPPAQLAEIVYGLELVQAIACGTPVPPAPTPTPTLAPKPKKHATGLIITPLAERKKLHVADALMHRAYHAKHGAVVLPQSLDLRSSLCPPIEDQDGVGTCHDHSGVDTVCCGNIKIGNLTTAQPLSVQYIVDLAPNNDGTCSGGDASTIFQWLKQGNGIPTVAAYGPETNACNQGCQLSTTAAGYTISDWGYASTVTGPADVLSVEESLATYGVTSVCIGCPDDFMNWGPNSGIYTGDLSSGIDHQVSLVGYTIDASVPGGGYFILRNSWGQNWGENGYARVSFASNATTEAMWVTAAAGQTTVVSPWASPQPTPTRRGIDAADKVHRLYNSGKPEDRAKALRAIQAAEDVLGNAN